MSTDNSLRAKVLTHLQPIVMLEKMKQPRTTSHPLPPSGKVSFASTETMEVVSTSTKAGENHPSELVPFQSTVLLTEWKSLFCMLVFSLEELSIFLRGMRGEEEYANGIGGSLECTTVRFNLPLYDPHIGGADHDFDTMSKIPCVHSIL